MKKAIGVAMALLVAGAGALAWLRAQKGFSARDEPSMAEAFAARTMRSVSMPSRAKALKSPKAIDAEGLAAARMHWADHCAICHGNDGGGDTPMGRGLFPKPPNMRSPLTQSKSDGELFYTIENGIRLTGMPAWGDGNSHIAESWALVAFIRTLPQLTAEDVKQIGAMTPKSAHEAMEAKEEEDKFLRGDSTEPEHSHAL